MQLCCVVVERNAWAGGVWGGGPLLWEDSVQVRYDLAIIPPTFHTCTTHKTFLPSIFNMKTIDRSICSQTLDFVVCETAWKLSCHDLLNILKCKSHNYTPHKSQTQITQGLNCTKLKQTKSYTTQQTNSKPHNNEIKQIETKQIKLKWTSHEKIFTQFKLHKIKTNQITHNEIKQLENTQIKSKWTGNKQNHTQRNKRIQNHTTTK